MKTFREMIINESSNKDLEVIGMVVKNKHFSKNASIFDNKIYFEFKDVKGALRLSKKLSDYVGINSIVGIGAGKIGFYETHINAILDIPVETAVAYMEITFEGDIDQDIVKASKATITNISDFQSRLKEINKG